MTRAATDERRRRWSAHIDLQRGVTRIRPIDEDPRPSPQSSALLDAVRRPARPEPPPHFEAQLQPEPEPEPHPEFVGDAPAQPWARQVAPAAQPQDADRRAGTDVRIPSAEPAAVQPQEADSSADDLTDRVVGRVRQMLGLPPEQPPVAPPHVESPLDYVQLNPAGAFAQRSDGAAEALAPELNPAGSFTADP